MQNPLNLIVPIAAPVAENYQTLKNVLTEVNYYSDTFDQIRTVHFARFLFLEKDESLPDEVYTQFALITTFSGDFNEYVDDFVQIAEKFDDLLSCLEGGKDVTPVKKKPDTLKTYLKKYNRLSQNFYSAYPYVSVVDILAKFPKNKS
jgi:hypothetical protein